MWDGKIGIWECVDFVAARRSSRHRAKGTIEPKPYNIDGKRYKELLLEKVLPAIKENCPPSMLRNTVCIQHDNAPPHRAAVTDDPDIVGCCNNLGLKPIKVIEQPPNSPDLNILDLGVFRSLQSRQFKKTPTTMQELINSTKEVYTEFLMHLVDNVWLMLQTVMNKIIECDGDNNYNLPHMNKRKLEHSGLLP